MILSKRLTNGILRYKRFNTKLGASCLIWHDAGILRFSLPCHDKTVVSHILHDEFQGIKLSSSNEYRDAVDDIAAYFEGERRDFNYPVDTSLSTNFQSAVYKITRTIPYGSVVTYKWVSSYLENHKAQRAVGMALSKNLCPLFIPCHRVIRSDGKLGGFTAPGGVTMKREMLGIEGCSYQGAVVRIL